MGLRSKPPTPWPRDFMPQFGSNPIPCSPNRLVKASARCPIAHWYLSICLGKRRIHLKCEFPFSGPTEHGSLRRPVGTDQAPGPLQEVVRPDLWRVLPTGRQRERSWWDPRPQFDYSNGGLIAKSYFIFSYLIKPAIDPVDLIILSEDKIDI